MLLCKFCSNIVVFNIVDIFYIQVMSLAFIWDPFFCRDLTLANELTLIDHFTINTIFIYLN